MSDLQSSRIHFSGYQFQPNHKARLFLPGHESLTHQPEGQQPVAEVMEPGEVEPKNIPMRWNADGDVWETSQSVSPGTSYRFRTGDKTSAPILDLLETTQKDSYGVFNRVAENALNAPQRSTVMADIYLDSLVDTERFEALKKEHGGLLPLRNHFNRFGRPDGNYAGLKALLPHFRDAGFSSLLFKPFIGGDNLSSHGYWTNDPYVLNNSFKDKAEFRTALLDMLRHGMKIYADGAFVNQGLSGVQVLSNMAHGYRSPYWNWFKYGDDHQVPGLKPGEPVDFNKKITPWDYPAHTHENRKFNIGILPTEMQPDGHRRINSGRFDVRFINPPDQPGYDARRPTYIELFDPTLPANAASPLKMRDSEMSVQGYRFPVDADEVREKKRISNAAHLKPQEEKELFTDWRHFRLVRSALDDSSVKWDGNVNVTLMNTKNPDVVQYLEGAVGYWSRMVMNTYADSVARTLSKAVTKLGGGAAGLNSTLTPAQLEQALSDITQRVDRPEDLTDATRILPPLQLPNVERLSAPEIQRVLQLTQPNGDGLNAQGVLFAKRVLNEIPLSTLPLPELFKGVLSYPALAKHLQQQSPSLWNRSIQSIFAPLVDLNILGWSRPGEIFRALRDWLSPPPFSGALGATLQKSLQFLQPDAQSKIRYDRIQSLMADKLGESILLSLFTGLDLKKLATHQFSPKDIENAFYQTVPADIANADPVTGEEKLERFLRGRLKQVDVAAVCHLLESQLKNLDPRLVAVADAVVQKREYGLNWRIDAAKDVADMDRVRNAPANERPALFEAEMKHADAFWKKLGRAMRAPFPKSSLIAELTDFKALSNEDTEKRLMQTMLSENTFSGTPSMNYLYSQLMRLVNYDQRPDEYGGNQLTPSQFLEHALEPMSRSIPFTALQQSQNMVASHDYSTASHALLINPALFTMDQLKWWGLRDDFTVASQELQDKRCFEADRQRLKHPENPEAAIPNLEGTLEYLRSLVSSPEWRQRLAAKYDGLPASAKPESIFRDLSGFYDEPAKKEDPDVRYVPTPHELKGRFVDALFELLTPDERKNAGLTNPAAAEALKTALKSRMTEFSEAKAMRGVIVNALPLLERPSPTSALNTLNGMTASSEGVSSGLSPSFWEQTQARYGLSAAQLATLKERFHASLWKALDTTIQQWGRHFGYQPLDIALQNVFQQMTSVEPKAMNTDWRQAVPALQNDAKAAKAFLNDVQTALYREASRPVLKKLLRVFAVQNAIPGNPSVYLPDWFAQGGSEWTQNIVVQNRALIRTDKQQNDPDYQAFAKQAGAIFRTRTGRPLLAGSERDNTRKNEQTHLSAAAASALNDGVLLNVPADDANGVLPLVRDNGTSQVITLVYTGQPQGLNWHDKAGRGPEYATIQTRPDGLKSYQTCLKSTSLTLGRTYRDMQTNERFRLNEHGVLENLTSGKAGIDIDTYRILVREPRQK